MSCAIFFFFLSDKKSVNVFVVENQRFVIFAFREGGGGSIFFRIFASAKMFIIAY